MGTLSVSHAVVSAILCGASARHATGHCRNRRRFAVAGIRSWPDTGAARRRSAPRPAAEPPASAVPEPCAGPGLDPAFGLVDLAGGHLRFDHRADLRIVVIG